MVETNASAKALMEKLAAAKASEGKPAEIPESEAQKVEFRKLRKRQVPKKNVGRRSISLWLTPDQWDRILNLVEASGPEATLGSVTLPLLMAECTRRGIE